MLFVTSFLTIPAAEIEFTYARSSGPGGQAVNKVNSKAVLRWNVHRSGALPFPVRQRLLAAYGNRLTNEGDLLITSDRFRDRSMNQSDCLEKLRELLLEVAFPPKIRRATKPTRGSRERKLSTKKKHGEKKKGRAKGGWDD